MNSLVPIIYKHFSLVLKKEELQSFLDYFAQCELFTDIKKDYKERLVLTIWKEDVKQGVSICLELDGDTYIIHQKIETSHPILEEAIRNCIPRFHVTTVAEHHFSDSAMFYHYQDGVIHKIIEKDAVNEKTIYEFPLQLLYEKRTERIKKEINILLDRRNDRAFLHEIPRIDQELKILSAKMKKQKHH